MLLAILLLIRTQSSSLNTLNFGISLFLITGCAVLMDYSQVQNPPSCLSLYNHSSEINNVNIFLIKNVQKLLKDPHMEIFFLILSSNNANTDIT